MADRFLSAYYFMGQDLCINRSHTRADMAFLAENGFDAIAAGVHDEQWRAPRGLGLVCDEAHRAGLKVLAIPSRWCGLIAGWPTLAGHFAATRPDVWMRREDGSPLIKGFCGPVCSVHHPDVLDYMVAATERMLRTWELDGIVWDELKTLHETDHHPLALKAFGGPAAGRVQIDASLAIFAACNRQARAAGRDLRICSFLYAHLGDEIVQPWSRTEGFDDVGLDGRCWRADDDASTPKLLLEHAPRFAAHARAAGRRCLVLIETQHLDAAGARRTLARLPDLLAMGLDHLLVYYHPLVEQPEAQITDAVAPLLAAWRRGRSAAGASGAG